MDTIEGGKWLPHQELAWTLVTKAIERVQELENEIGCFFDRNPDGTLHGKAFAGQTFDRTVHKGDLTGIEIINRLMEQVWARPIRRLEEHRAVALIPATDGSLAGVLLIDVRTGEFRFVSAQAVLLATGGGPTMYRYHTPSGDKSMDGLAMALRFGLPLRDMEMVQFHPTGLLAGPDTRMTGTVLEEGLRGAGGHLLNGFDAALHGRLRPETRARHARRGQPRHLRGDEGRPHHAERRRLYQDGPSRPGQGSEAIQRHGRSLPRLRFRSRRRPRRSGPHRALFHGRRDLRGRYRDGVFRPVCRRRGRQRHAWREPARRQWRRQLDRVRRHRRRRDAAASSPKIPVIARPIRACSMPRSTARCIPSAASRAISMPLREDLLDTMWDEVGVVRDRASIERGIAGIDRIEAELLATGTADAGRRFNLTWHDWLNLRSLCEISRVIALAALKRENSRGAHYRVRFPGAGRSRNLDLHRGATYIRRDRDRRPAGRLQPREAGPDFTARSDRSRIEANMIPLSSIQRTAEDFDGQGGNRNPGRLSRRLAPLRRYRKRRSVLLRHQGDAGELRGGQRGSPRHVRRHRPAALVRQNRQRRAH